MRSHVLRHEVEEFRRTCLEFVQYGFDVLSLVLDQKEKRAHGRETASPSVKGSARKRARDIDSSDINVGMGGMKKITQRNVRMRWKRVIFISTFYLHLLLIWTLGVLHTFLLIQVLHHLTTALFLPLHIPLLS